MTLDEYLKRENMTLTTFGALFDPPAAASVVGRWRNGSALPRPATITAIMEATEGAVTYMDVWRVWATANGLAEDA